MLKVVLRYTDCLQDGKNVFSTLGEQDLKILKTKQPFASIYPKVTILVKDSRELNELISKLNRRCHYEVSIIKVKEAKGKRYGI